ncbi:MAG: Type pilus biosis and competence protein pilQ precursor [Pseudomonadota bacterium]
MRSGRLLRGAFAHSLLLVFLFGGLTVAGASVSASQGLTPYTPLTNVSGDIVLTLAEADLLRLPGLRRVVVGDGSMLSAQPLDDGSVLLIGKKPGQTSILIWAEGLTGVRKTVVIQSPEADRLAREVRTALGRADTRVSVNPVGEQLVLSGQADSPEQAERLKSLVERNAKLVNLTQAEGNEQMIAMEVRFLEVKKNALENLGIQWQTRMAGPMVGLVGDFKTNNTFRSTSDGLLNQGAPNISGNFPGTESAAWSPKVSPFALYFGMQSTLTSVIQFMEQQGDAVVLAEPILSTRSGGTAKFLAGGEIPLPVTSSLGASSVQFKPYGIRFEIQPRVLDNGVIRATVTTELSTVDPAIRVGELPGFLSRMTETQVNLREGQTLVMSGLISEESSRVTDKVSGLGDIPVLGALFRSKDFRDKRSEMVVMVTPRFIRPDDAFHRARQAWSQEQIDAHRAASTASKQSTKDAKQSAVQSPKTGEGVTP